MYSREIDEKTLTLTTSGWTYYRQHVLFDLETESFWFHMEGSSDLTCIAGHYAGRALRGIESIKSPWPIWQLEHPDTKILNAQR